MVELATWYTIVLGGLLVDNVEHLVVCYTVNLFTSNITLPLISQALECGYSSKLVMIYQRYILIWVFSIYWDCLTSSPVAQLQGMCFDSPVWRNAVAMHGGWWGCRNVSRNPLQPTSCIYFKYATLMPFLSPTSNLAIVYREICVVEFCRIITIAVVNWVAKKVKTAIGYLVKRKHPVVVLFLGSTLMRSSAIFVK